MTEYLWSKNPLDGRPLDDAPAGKTGGQTPNAD